MKNDNEKRTKMKKHEENATNAKSLKISDVFVFTRKNFDGFVVVFFSARSFRISMICFRNVCFSQESQQPIWGSHLFFKGKVTISVGRETKHTFYRKINENIR